MTSPDPSSAADAIETAWEEVDHAWDDEAVHKRFVALCVALDRLADAGARYRAVRESSPERAEASQRHIEALFAAATARLDLTRTVPNPDAKRRVTLVALIVSLSMIIVAAWLSLRFG